MYLFGVNLRKYILYDVDQIRFRYFMWEIPRQEQQLQTLKEWEN